jgi:hypothetical protein
MTPVVRLACLACAVAACVSDSTPSVDSSTAAADTASRPPAFTYSLDTLWRIVGSDPGSPLREPVTIEADSIAVWVSDRVSGLVALSDSGTPLELAVEPTPIQTTDFIVVERGEGVARGVQAELNGTRLALVFAGSMKAHDICLTRPWRILAAGGDHPLGVAEISSPTISPVELPWPELRDSSTLLQQVSLATLPGGNGCVVAPVFGGGFATTSEGEFFQRFPTRERVALPRVDQFTDSTPNVITHEERLRDYLPATLAVAATDTTILLAFAGATPIRQGLIDLYHWRRGTYLGSAAVGTSIRSLAARGDTIFVVHPYEDRVAVSAFRLVPTPGR